MIRKGWLSLVFLACTVFMTNVKADADDSYWLSLIEMYQSSMASYIQDMKGLESQIKDYEQSISQAMQGNYGWGSFNTKDFGSYGSGAQDWSSVLQLAQGGGNAGPLGQTIKQMASQFPINAPAINQAVSDPLTQHYYALQAQTTLASRAASQLDFNKIQEQMDYQNQLRSQIEKTTNLKSAVDLQSRIQVENNLIQLAMLRQLSLTNQQQSVASQGALNGALLNAQFLNH